MLRVNKSKSLFLIFLSCTVTSNCGGVVENASALSLKMNGGSPSEDPHSFHWSHHPLPLSAIDVSDPSDASNVQPDVVEDLRHRYDEGANDDV